MVKIVKGSPLLTTRDHSVLENDETVHWKVLSLTDYDLTTPNLELNVVFEMMQWLFFSKQCTNQCTITYRQDDRFKTDSPGPKSHQTYTNIENQKASNLTHLN